MDRPPIVEPSAGVHIEPCAHQKLPFKDLKKAVEEVQRVAHRALVRVQTRNDDEA